MSTFSKVLRHAERERLFQGEARPPRPAALEPVQPASTSDVGPPLAGVEHHLVSLLYPASLVAETYRALRHQIEQVHRTAQASTVLAVSSAGVGDGKTTTSINLAGALAQATDARVLLVDADLRNPSIARYLALDKGPGLVDAILDPGLSLERVVRVRSPFNLDVLCAGTPPPTPYEILRSPRLGDLLGEARRRYDYVVLDTAPLVLVPDSRLLGKWIDGLVLVVSAHKTPRRLLGEALNLLEPEKLVGLVFNEDGGILAGDYGYPPYDASLHQSGPIWWRSLVGRLARLLHV